MLPPLIPVSSRYFLPFAAYLLGPGRLLIIAAASLPPRIMRLFAGPASNYLPGPFFNLSPLPPRFAAVFAPGRLLPAATLARFAVYSPPAPAGNFIWIYLPLMPLAHRRFRARRHRAILWLRKWPLPCIIPGWLGPSHIQAVFARWAISAAIHHYHRQPPAPLFRLAFPAVPHTNLNSGLILPAWPFRQVFAAACIHRQALRWLPGVQPQYRYSRF